MRGLAQSLASSGMAVELPLLPGHGTAVEDLLPCRWAHWSAAAEAAYGELASRCRRVFLVGLSMGGTLACWLATRHAPAGVVAVNPYVEAPADSFGEILEGVLAAGFELAPGVGADIADPEVAELAYEATPIRAAQSLFAAVAALDLSRIACPVLLFQSRRDHVVPPQGGDLLIREVSGPIERVWLERSHHVATLDYDHAEIEQRALAFLGNLSGGADPPYPPAWEPGVT